VQEFIPGPEMLGKRHGDDLNTCQQKQHAAETRTGPPRIKPDIKAKRRGDGDSAHARLVHSILFLQTPKLRSPHKDWRLNVGPTLPETARSRWLGSDPHDSGVDSERAH
jgi:hypothetical protein